MAETSDVVIIGGGAIGCSIAYQLSKSGVKSTVLEQHRLGSAASGATGGLVTPLWHINRSVQPNFDVGVRGIQLFPAWADELKEAGLDPQFQPTGVLKVARTAEEVEELHAGLAWQSEMGLDVGWLDADDVLNREPCAPPDVMGGVFSPHEGIVVGESFCYALANAAARNGATVRENVEVTALETDDRRVIGVRTPDGVVHADHVVLAAGPWSGIARRWLPDDLPVTPVKGLGVILRKPGFHPRSPILTFAGSMQPRPGGNVMVGSNREPGRFDENIEAAPVSYVLDRAMKASPGLSDAEFVSARAGVRPATPDGLPVMGPVPGWDGLSIASGHDSIGIMQAPGSAELMAGYIQTGDSEPLEPFSLARFL